MAMPQQAVEQTTKKQWWYPRNPSEEMSGPQRILTCEEFGFLTRLRDYSFENDGLPDDEKFFKSLAQSFRLSMYKLKKLWPELEKYFTKIDGIFYYEDDEVRRLQQVTRIDKCKIAGLLGAKKRWSERTSPPVQMKLEPDRVPYGDPMPDGMAENGKLHPQSEKEVSITGEPAAAPVQGAATAAPTQISHTLNETEHQAIGVRSMELHMQAPDRTLALKLKSHFGLPVCDLIPLLVCFPGQTSPGLWLHKSIQDLGLERSRQQMTPERKSAKQEAQERSDARVLETLQNIKKRAMEA